jgi:hypothetical protein
MSFYAVLPEWHDLGPDDEDGEVDGLANKESRL